MKVRLLLGLVVLICLSASPSFAQVNFSSGVKAGVNFANLSLDPEDEFCCDPKTGFIGGLFVTAPIGDSIAIQPEFLYSMIGAKADVDDFDSEIDIRVFQIPILFRADFAGASVRPFVLAGPALSFRLDAKEKFEDEESDLDEDVEKVDIGFAIGAGLQFGRGSLEARYTHGLRDIDKDDESKAKTRVFSVLAGFRF
jgi:hypothetical protein